MAKPKTIAELTQELLSQEKAIKSYRTLANQSAKKVRELRKLIAINCQEMFIANAPHLVEDPADFGYGPIKSTDELKEFVEGSYSPVPTNGK